MRRSVTATAVLCLGALPLAACSSDKDSGGGADATVAAGQTVKVTTSFYPIEFATEQIGGSHVKVTSLTKAGAEPHDVELTAQDIAGLGSTDLVLYSKGFQPAVDEAVDQNAKDTAVDLSGAADLTLEGHEDEHGEEGHDHGDEATGEAADATGEAHDDHDHGGKDPHFWLDPKRYAAVATEIGDKLAAKDPSNAADYKKNTAAFVARLDTLNEQFAAGLRTCRNRHLVTSHEAFGYLAQRYDFEQVGIAGLDPDAEPSAAKLAEIGKLVKAEGVTTIYAETLVEPAFAETVAKSTGAKVATLDPVEGITDTSAGKDYFSVMDANLKALEQGQSCS